MGSAVGTGWVWFAAHGEGRGCKGVSGMGAEMSPQKSWVRVNSKWYIEILVGEAAA